MSKKPIVEMGIALIMGKGGNRTAMGYVEKHPELPCESRSESRIVQTSYIVRVCKESNTVETRNTIYHVKGFAKTLDEVMLGGSNEEDI